jgi:hypothetical protein
VVADDVSEADLATTSATRGSTTSDLMTAILCTTVAGGFIPLGGFLARIERIRPLWLEREPRHSVIKRSVDP